MTVNDDRFAQQERQARISRWISVVGLVIFVAFQWVGIYTNRWGAGGPGGGSSEGAATAIGFGWCLAIGIAVMLVQQLRDISRDREVAKLFDGAVVRGAFKTPSLTRAIDGGHKEDRNIPHYFSIVGEPERFAIWAGGGPEAVYWIPWADVESVTVGHVDVGVIPFRSLIVARRTSSGVLDYPFPVIGPGFAGLTAERRDVLEELAAELTAARDRCRELPTSAA